MSYELFDTCTRYPVIVDRIPEAIKRKLENEYDLCNSREWMTASDIDQYDIPSEAVVYDEADFDTVEAESLLEDDLGGSFPHYLVLANHCRWNGASGYKFCDDINKTYERSYTINLTVVEKGKHAIRCIESSHDKPTGGTTIIVGLSESRYTKLVNADFDTIEDWANTRFK